MATSTASFRKLPASNDWRIVARYAVSLNGVRIGTVESSLTSSTSKLWTARFAGTLLSTGHTTRTAAADVLVRKALARKAG